MSNSEFVLIEEGEEVLEFKILVTPGLIYEDDSPATAPDLPEHKRREQEKDKRKEDESYFEVKIPSKEFESSSLGEFKIEEDNDGFRTPTSLDHKIPVNKQCPPAPRKPKASMKRKVPSNRVRRSIPLDLSEEVKSLFSIPLLCDSSPKIKKARRDDEATSKL